MFDKNVVLYNLSLPCANNHPSEMRTIILTPSTWQFLHLQDWLINWLAHSCQHLTSTFQTDLIITFLAQIDVRMSMISALEMFHQVTQLDDWTLVLHCYIRQLNNLCNNGHCFCINKNISFIKRSQFSKIDRFIGGNLMKQKLTKDKGTRSQLKDVKSKLYKRYK